MQLELFQLPMFPDLVPPNGDVMSIAVGVNGLEAAVLDDESLDDHIRCVAQVEIGPSAVTTI